MCEVVEGQAVAFSRQISDIQEALVRWMKVVRYVEGFC
jgi:hypothetical protein